MTDAFTGQISAYGFSWAPRNWGLCNGALVNISQNTALFSLIGCQFGGDCRVTFALPDLRGRVPLNYGQGAGLPNYPFAQRGGTATHQLTTAQMPSHNHTLAANATSSSTNVPTGAYLALAQDQNRNAVAVYSSSKNANMNAQAIGNTGSGTPFNIMPAYITINFSMCLVGIYPSRP